MKKNGEEKSKVGLKESKSTFQTVRDRCFQLFTSGRLHDCEFLVGEEANMKTFKAHRTILAMTSEVFEAMLFGSLREEGAIRVTDIPPETFRMLLQHIYSDECEIKSWWQANQLYRAADKYFIDSLKKPCMEYIYSTLSSENAVQLIHFAEQYSESGLLEKCWKLVKAQADAVMVSRTILNAPRSTLNRLLELSGLKVSSELVVFRMLLRWSEKECDRNGLEAIPSNQREVLADTLRRVRFLTMSASTFCDEPLKSGLLLPEECLAVLANCVKPDSLPLPPNICASRSSRALEDMFTSKTAATTSNGHVFVFGEPSPVGKGARK